MKNAVPYRVLGMMSGTSLDGLDLAYCEFHQKRGWSFRVIKTTTLPYSDEWHTKLATAHQLSGEALLRLHVTYGDFLGSVARNFVKKHKLPAPHVVASHGHTIFHQPQHKLTFQLGEGATLHAACGWPVAADFRSQDVALGGEGAPLVPIGDSVLFGQYDVCMNLGGIANLSMILRGQRKAFDICFCNQPLNELCRQHGLTMDDRGKIAASGHIHEGLRKSIQAVYDSMRGSKPSLGREGFERDILPLINNNSISFPDRLRTVIESIAYEIGLATKGRKGTLLITGGGAHNDFLVTRLREMCVNLQVIKPSNEIIEFKEAIIFGFLGVLRMRNESNVLKSVTGASRDSCSGQTWHG